MAEGEGRAEIFGETAEGSRHGFNSSRGGRLIGDQVERTEEQRGGTWEDEKRDESEVGALDADAASGARSNIGV